MKTPKLYTSMNKNQLIRDILKKDKMIEELKSEKEALEKELLKYKMQIPLPQQINT